MPSLLACYRYPVKGMTPESLPALRLESGRSPDGDRAFAFVFANAQPLGADGWVDKHHALTLLNTPGLARVTAAYDAASRVLSLRTADKIQRSAALDREQERAALAAWLAQIVQGFALNPLLGHDERLPLRLLGDGRTLFTDRGPAQVSLAAQATLDDLAARTGVALDARRFRLNLLVRDAPPLAERDWPGKRVRIGETLLAVTEPLGRCRAVDASPDGADRDTDLLPMLHRSYGHRDLGVLATVLAGGTVRPGDTIDILN